MPCNPDGRAITWECQVYSPHDPDTSLSVKWYRSASEVSIREEGELITERKGGRYTFSVTHATSPLNNSQMIVNGLFLDHFQLTIHSYDSSIDGGYYWCQMVVNITTCLQPSDTGRIPQSSRNCSFSSFDFIEFEMPQVCARRSSCTREVMTTEAEPSVSSTIERTTSSSLGTTFAANNNASESETMAVTFYAIIGVLAFIFVILLLVIVALVVHTVRNHRVYEIKQECKLIFIHLHNHTVLSSHTTFSYALILGDHELRSRAVEDPPHPLFDVHDQFTQTGDDTDSEVAHRSGN